MTWKWPSTDYYIKVSHQLTKLNVCTIKFLRPWLKNDLTLSMLTLNWISSACIVQAAQAGPLYVNTTISMVCSHLPSSLLLGIQWVLVIDQVTVPGTLDPSSFHSSKGKKLSTPGLDCPNWLESGRNRNLFRRPLQQHFTPCSVYPEARDRLADKFGACKSPNDVLRLRLLRPLLPVSEMSTIFSYLKIGPPLNGSGTFRQMTWKRFVCLWLWKNTRWYHKDFQPRQWL